MKKSFPSVVLFILLLTVGCSKEKMLVRRLEGTWTIDRWDYFVLGYNYSVSNVGTVTFNKNGTGKNNWNYKDPINGNQVTNTNTFSWSNTENTVTIKGNPANNEPDVVWTVEENKKRTQIWTTNLGLISAKIYLSKI